MLPSSLLLDELFFKNLKTFDSKRYNKTMTADVINVKFNQKVRSGKEIIKCIDKKILELNKNEEARCDKLLEYEKMIQIDVNQSKWIEIKTKDLRTLMYKNGFVISDLDKKTEEVKQTEYVVWSRSSSKSRSGQVLFIKKSMRDKMIKFMRMDMNLDGRNDIDFPALLSYESLTGSAIEDYLTIDENNIFIVSDVKSIFKADVNIVEKDKNELLTSRPYDGYQMESDIFDGEGLLESFYFKNNKGMMLLRQHMFKCCVFSTNIQKFLKLNCPGGINYDNWQLSDLFGNIRFAKDIHLITTPASCKFLKFSKVKGSKNRMYSVWLDKLKNSNYRFGICKSEKESKRGYDNITGKILNQTSYQMLNSMRISANNMKMLAQYELDYIEQLKNNPDTYIEFLRNQANDMNCNNMLSDLYEHNKKLVSTKTLKDKRKKDIHNYKNYVAKGKLRLIGDYCTIIQNGKELLFHTIGKLPVEDGILNYNAWSSEMILTENQAYTTQHEFGKDYVCFRNPHTSPSNVLIIKNTDSQFIRDYFNFTPNIIYTNAIGFPINRILSGQDVDSDNLVIFDCNILKLNAIQCFGKYRVCINNVSKNENPYTVCTEDMAKIDNILAESQTNIGRVVNLGQHYMSTYYDMINKGSADKKTIEKLLQAVDVCTILSEICIDSAKRLYDIDTDIQIKELNKSKLLRESKPLFFKHISRNGKIKDYVEKYETSMDYLQDVLEEIQDADTIETKNIISLLNKFDIKKVKEKQKMSIIECINEMTNSIKSIEAKYKDVDENDDTALKEKYNDLDDIKSDRFTKLKHYKIKAETIYSIIYSIFSGQVECKYKMELLDALYEINKEIFMSVFKKTK